MTDWFKNISDTDVLFFRTLQMIFKKNITSIILIGESVVLRGNDTRNRQKASSVHSVPLLLGYSNAISNSSFLGQEKGRLFNPSGKREA